MKIGICTIFGGNHNYGGMLQAYALQAILKEYNEDTETLHFSYGKNPIYPNLISRAKQYSLNQLLKKIKELQIEKKTHLIEKKLAERHKLFRKFADENIKQSEFYEEINQIGNKYDILIVGSDQVWNPNMVRKVMMLDFTTHAKKLSYAASIGRANLSKSEKEYMIPCINKFDAVSVREKTAQNILLDSNIKCDVVLDPTMLLRKEQWIEKMGKRQVNGKYILLYAFSECTFTEELINYWNKQNIKCIYIPYAKQKFNTFDKENKMEPIWDVGPSEFLSLINYAEFVYTDSFHGAVFSILLNKQFYVFERSKKKSRVSMNSRLYDLLDTINLSDRLITSYQQKELAPINYNLINHKIDLLRVESISWLKSALNKTT